MFGFDPAVAVVGFVVGTIVGLTGMGGGALMTPLLVLLFGVAPTTAVTSDLVASVFMKPLGAAVHMRRGTVDRRLVRLLVLGSVPAAFASASALHLVAAPKLVEAALRPVLGVALVVAAVAMALKAFLKDRREGSSGAPAPVRPVLTVVIGVVGGVVVGATSVGSGSLMMVSLMLTYPTLAGARLVGTDLAQAVPLVLAAALGHALFGAVDAPLTLSLMVGALPGVYMGARSSSALPERVIRPLLVLALAVSGLELLAVPTAILVSSIAGGLAAVGLVGASRRLGSPLRS